MEIYFRGSICSRTLGNWYNLDYIYSLTGLSPCQLLDLTGAIVTIDAMRTQTEIVKQIRHKKAAYIVSLKANYPLYLLRLKKGFIREEPITLKALTLVITHSLTTDTIARKNVRFGLFL
jgi:hypothetical protein